MAEFTPIPVEKKSSTFTPIPVEKKSSTFTPIPVESTDQGEGVPKELLEGVITGASKIVQGPLELAASGIDAIAGNGS